MAEVVSQPLIACKNNIESDMVPNCSLNNLMLYTLEGLLRTPGFNMYSSVFESDEDNSITSISVSSATTVTGSGHHGISYLMYP